MSVLALLSLLPLFAYSSPTPHLSRREILPSNATDPLIPRLPIPYGGQGNASDCAARLNNPGLVNLWSGFTKLQPPDVAGDPSIPIQTYQPPLPTGCDLFAWLTFPTYTAKLGNTQTLLLPSNRVYILSYGLSATTAHIVSVKVFTAPPPPSTEPYKVATLTPSPAPLDQVGTIAFVTPPTKDNAPLNTHLEIRFSDPTAQGTIGLFSTTLTPGTPQTTDAMHKLPLNAHGGYGPLALLLNRLFWAVYDAA